MFDLISLINPISWIEKISKWIGRPIFELYYDSKETYHKRHEILSDLDGMFCHVMVKNKGKSLAENCTGELLKVEKYIGTEFINENNYLNTMTLKWAHEKDWSPKDIEAGDKKRLDLCYTLNGQDLIHFFTEKYPNGSQSDFSPGVYRITVRVRGDNVKAVKKMFKIEYYGNNFENLKISEYAN